MSEGCYLCHSQMVRPILSETTRYGEYSKAGEFVYDHPFQWGSRRIGPDLAREGTKPLNEFWHLLHFQDPAQVTPGSIMPKYTWLIADKIDFDSMSKRVKAMRTMGVPYTDADRDGAADNARAQARAIAGNIVAQSGRPELSSLQDKQIISLIAYVKRLGTDIFAAPPAPQGGVLDTKPAASTQPSDR